MRHCPGRRLDIPWHRRNRRICLKHMPGGTTQEHTTGHCSTASTSCSLAEGVGLSTSLRGLQLQSNLSLINDSPCFRTLFTLSYEQGDKRHAGSLAIHFCVLQGSVPLAQCATLHCTDTFSWVWQPCSAPLELGALQLCRIFQVHFLMWGQTLPTCSLQALPFSVSSVTSTKSSSLSSLEATVWALVCAY